MENRTINESEAHRNDLLKNQPARKLTKEESDRLTQSFTKTPRRSKYGR